MLHDLHDRGGDGTFTVTSRGVARVFSALGFAPSPGVTPLTLRVEKTDSGGERWIRNVAANPLVDVKAVIAGVSRTVR